jgi:microsomal dipeptidase-like Zn-dependent dipeptidase
MTYAHDTPQSQESDRSNGLLSMPAVTLLAAGAIGFAVGAVIWQYRRTHPQRFGSFDRAVDMARSGAVDTVQKLRKRLREEGYSPAQIEGRAKKYLAQVIDAAQSRF